MYARINAIFHLQVPVIDSVIHISFCLSNGHIEDFGTSKWLKFQHTCTLLSKKGELLASNHFFPLSAIIISEVVSSEQPTLARAIEFRVESDTRRHRASRYRENL